MSGATMAVLATTAAVGTAYSVYAGERAAGQQQQAQAEAKKAATEQANQADQANNKANAKRADVGGLLSANMQQAQGGGSSTMLTGPTGVDPGSLNLGRNTLLGS
jgi:regulator of protease activity HflC (stomatin/prohibitin superfamily)